MLLVYFSSIVVKLDQDVQVFQMNVKSGREIIWIPLKSLIEFVSFLKLSDRIRDNFDFHHTNLFLDVVLDGVWCEKSSSGSGFDSYNITCRM